MYVYVPVYVYANNTTGCPVLLVRWFLVVLSVPPSGGDRSRINTGADLCSAVSYEADCATMWNCSTCGY